MLTPRFDTMITALAMALVILLGAIAPALNMVRCIATDCAQPKLIGR